jgi:hypothetical protein
MDKTQEVRQLANRGADLQQELQDAGVAATPKTSALETQLSQQRIEAAAKAMDPKAGRAAKQAGIKKATVSKNPQVETARRIARDLAANGPITVDDVTEVLVQKGYETAEPKQGDKPSKWKGAIFRTSEWVRIDTEPSRLTRSHVRPNNLWALKSWLAENSVNGKRLAVSRFDMDGIRRDFERANPGIPKDSCHWFVGTSKLADDVALDIRQADNTYDEVPVTFIPHAVGAVLQYVPPQVPVFRHEPAAPAPTTAQTVPEA